MSSCSSPPPCSSPRIIMTAGKGGVGKSTIAAATAAVCASQGLQTLVMSVDSAHNLGDLYRQPLGHLPTQLAENLFGLEVDINRELADNWHAVTDFLRSMTAHNPRVSELVAEECAVLPGMEEVFGLMRLQAVAQSGAYDVIVVDAPPTGDMLKFLRLPDVLQWFMEKYHPFERTVLQRIRPVAEAVGVFVPTDETLQEVQGWYERVKAASATLTHQERVTVRLVMTPDRVGLAETRRALSWTSLLGMHVDAVMVNKVLPPADYPPPVAGWANEQMRVLEETRQAFSLPVVTAPLCEREILGVEALAEFGRNLYTEREAAAVWVTERPLSWTERADGAELRLRLPFLRKGEFRLLTGSEGLSLMIGNQRHIVPLPPGIRRRRMLGAKYEGEWLTVRYGA